MHSTEEEEGREEVFSDVIKLTTVKWTECQDFFEKHNPDISIMNSVESHEWQWDFIFLGGYAAQEKSR